MRNPRDRPFDYDAIDVARFPIDHGECALCGRPIIQRSFLDHGPSVINHIDYAHRACVEQALRDGRAYELPPAYERFRNAFPNRR